MFKEFTKDMIECGMHVLTDDQVDFKIMSFKNELYAVSHDKYVKLEYFCNNDLTGKRENSNIFQVKIDAKVIWQRKEQKLLTIKEAEKVLNQNSDVEYKIEV